MKGKLNQFLLLAVFIFFASIKTAPALDVPALRGRVNDHAGVMSAEQAQALESRLAQFEAETGHQVAVLTIPTLDGEDIEGFSIRVAENWKIGKKGYDNGVILVVARGQQRPLVEKAMQHMKAIGARLAGLVFNRAQARDFDRSVNRLSMARSIARHGARPAGLARPSRP